MLFKAYQLKQIRYLAKHANIDSLVKTIDQRLYDKEYYLNDTDMKNFLTGIYNNVKESKKSSS